MHKADEKQGSMISEAGQRNKQLQVFRIDGFMEHIRAFNSRSISVFFHRN